jgi:hypothetical protein
MSGSYRVAAHTASAWVAAAANLMPHAGEQFRQRHGDYGVIFNDEHAKGCHQLPLFSHPQEAERHAGMN